MMNVEKSPMHHSPTSPDSITQFDRPAMFTRRRFVQTAGSLTAAVMAGLPRQGFAAPSAKIIDTKVISQEPQYYHGWPTIARRQDGTLLVVCSGGRQKHICPFGRVELMVSHDDGAKWSWPRTILDTDLDDRDAGIVETAKGTLIATTFTSLVYEQFIKTLESGKSTPFVNADTLPAWKAARDRLSAEERQAELGQWLIRSTDGGRNWSTRVPTIVNSPHGPIQLKDGRLLYAGKQLWTEEKKVGVCESRDDGLTWQWLAEIPTRAGDNATKDYHELHAVETPDGTLIAHIRHEGKTDKNWTLQSESKDGGRSWSEPHPVCFGLPSHLLPLRDGRLLMTYGHRQAPFGNQARVSADHGQTWSEPMIVSGDGVGGDLGYPSTVELGDGSLLTVWYESMKSGTTEAEVHGGQSFAVLRQARWTLVS